MMNSLCTSLFFLGWCHTISVAVGRRQNWWEWVILRGGMCSRQGREGRRGGRRVGGAGREREKEYNFVPKLECLLSSLSFNSWGEFIPWCVPFKENKHLFIFKFTTSFVPTPCLYQNWSSGTWNDDGPTLTPEKFSWIHPLVSKDSLPGQLLIPAEIKEAAGLTP